MKNSLQVRLSGLLLSVIGAIVAAGPLRAATITVSSLADDGGAGELRQAIGTANGASGSTIVFKSGLTGTIKLSATLQALPVILVSTTIDGAGITIDGDGTYRPFNINAPSNTVTMSGLTIQHGQDAGGTGGAAILVQSGDLVLTSCMLKNNTATGDGGAICNFGTVTLTGCTVSGNIAYSGGGLYNYTYGGTLGVSTLTDCTLSGNSATINGGGICNYSYSGTGGTSALTDCTLTGNSTGANGGGIYDYCYSAAGGTAALTNCTLLLNSGAYGGGIYNYTYSGSGGTAALFNCTLTDNTGTFGGAMYNGNGGGAGGKALLTNCILYADTGGEVITSGGPVLATYCDIQGGVAGAGNINVNPSLGSLAGNGGATQTLALEKGSPCYMVGTPTGAPSADQRGYARPVQPSMGAFDGGDTYVLWNKAGQASLWNVTLAGKVSDTTFGPYNGWTPAGLASDASGNAFILWTNTNGEASIFQVSRSFNLTTSQTFGPYKGWTATSIASPPVGNVHVMWNGPSNAVSIFNIALGATYTSEAYGPYPGWQAQQIAVDSNNNTRVLWSDNSAGEGSLWNIAGSGAVTNQALGPYPNWQARYLAVSPDNLAQILWNYTLSDETSLFKIASNGSITAEALGPHPGWTAVGLAVNDDMDSNVIWNNASSELALYDVGSVGTVTFNSYGPYSSSGWKPIAVAAGP